MGSMTTKQPKVTRRKITEYLPDNHNANLGSERGLQMLEDSLHKVGAGRSLVVDANDRIPAGNKTLEAAVNAGYTDVIEIESDGKALIVHKRTDWDLDDPKGAARQYAYLDNRVSEVSLTWDANVIAADVEAGVDLSGMWTVPELELFGIDDLTDVAEDAGAQIDRAEELLQVWQVKRGDLWVIPSKSGRGEHRLLCGDSTNADDVARVMAGEKADMVFADPPYGYEYQSNMRTKSKKFEVIENDNRIIDGFIPLLDRFSCGWVLICTSWKVIEEWIAVTRSLGEMQNLIVWDKGGGGMGDLAHSLSTDYELIMAFNRGETIKGKRNGSVWAFGKDAAMSYEHPTQKPVELVTEALTTFSLKGNAIFIPFGGSGTDYVACEQTGRLGRGLELEPKYCAVILQRLSDMGLQPKLAE